MTKTIAENISNLCHDDGLCFTSTQGAQLADVLERHATHTYEENLLTKYVFEDDSSIVVGDGGWDLGCSPDPRCFCWDGVGCSCE
jgi:hypothetical protein